MRTYILKRLLLMVPTLLGVAAIVFLIMRVIPGDVALLILGGDDGGGRIDPKALAAVRQQLGLDQPLVVQFGAWLWGILQFDFGKSLWTGQPIAHELAIRLPLSLQISGRPFDEASVLRAGHAYQRATDWHRRRPALAA